MSLFLKTFFPSFIWNIPTEEKILFLTFDDGPVPDVTLWVLEILRQYQAKATFFCIGENVVKHPDIYAQIIKDGHSTGNHTFSHLNGWRTNSNIYLENVARCDSVLKHNERNSESASLNYKPQTTNSLFRPPYGRLRPSQISNLKQKFSIVLWDVLSKDWRQNHTGDQCFNRIKRKSKPGSIVLFHDSLKAEKRMKPALVMTLDYFSQQEYSFKGL